jgi:hypothetical protein
MNKPRPQSLGDFTTNRGIIPISLLAIGIGFVASGVAWLLLRLIGIFTNLFYYQRWDTSLSRQPAITWARGRSWCRLSERSSSD